MELKVVDIPRDGFALVDARKLRRVIHRGTREVLAELLPPDEAHAAAAFFNELRGAGIAVVLPYRADTLRAAQ
jgi:hypothetical protein